MNMKFAKAWARLTASEHLDVDAETDRKLTRSVLLGLVAAVTKLQQESAEMAITQEQLRDEVNTRLAALVTKVTGLTTVVDGVQAIVATVVNTMSGQATQIAALKTQLEELLAAQGIDPALFAPLFASMDTQIAQVEVEAQQLAAEAAALSAGVASVTPATT